MDFQASGHDLIEVSEWVRKNPELFGYILDRALDGAIEEGSVENRTIAAKRLSTNRQTLYQWCSGERTPSDINQMIKNLAALSPKAGRMFEKELARLQSVPDDQAVQDPEWAELWEKKCATEFNEILADKAWAWLFPWPGLTLDRATLQYDSGAHRYENVIPPRAKKALERWEEKNPHRASQLLDEIEEGWGTQVRLEWVKLASGHGKPDHYTIGLSGSRFRYYAAIQARMDKRERELLELRNECFENAIEALIRGENLLLPSVFSIHMAVITRDNKAVLRLRPHDTPMFPDAWECSVGEMMHGPAYKGIFPHFDQGQPSLDLFLKNAVAEELAYTDTRPDQFRLYGFAAEYATLAPKLIVVCHTDALGSSLRTKVKSKLTQDRGADADLVDLTPEAVASVIRKYQRWGPTSKLALMLALLEMQPSDKAKEQIKRKVKKLVELG